MIAATVAFDLAVLGVFKYYGFFANEIGAFLDDIGLPMPLPLLTLALPIGLSFITFQAISYSVDVKRGLLEPASTLDFAIYLELLPPRGGRADRAGARVHPPAGQAARPQEVAVGAGVVLIMLGLVKKVVIADLPGP